MAAIGNQYKNVEQIIALCEENERDLPKEWIRPERKYPVHRSIIRHWDDLFVDRIFIPDEKVLKIHPVQYLRSPFLPSASYVRENYLMEELRDDHSTSNQQLLNERKKAHAIAITTFNRHVILQQRFSDQSAPTCVEMLLLDRKIPIDREFLISERKEVYPLHQIIKARGYESISKTTKNGLTIPFLMHCLDTGPGILTLADFYPRYIILDSISLMDQTAQIRDSHHGWAITISLDTLASYLDETSTFTHILGPINQAKPCEEKEAPPPSYSPPQQLAAYRSNPPPYFSPLPPSYSNPPTYSKPCAKPTDGHVE